MRSTSVVIALFLIVCPVAVEAGTPQTTAIMKISGMSGQIAIQVDQTDWSRIQGMPDPRAPRTSGSTNPLSARGSSSLTSRGGTLGGGGGGVGGAAIQDLSIAKNVDNSSPNLANKCTAGEHIPEVTIEFVTAGGNNQEYLVIEMTNVVIANISAQGASGDAAPTEELTLSYENVTWEYRPIGPAQRSTPPFTRSTPTRP